MARKRDRRLKARIRPQVFTLILVLARRGVEND